ncbi:MAG: four-carbon acid sugar kinase family protein, partial [Treponema sp.]|nr:four-carbon acid sugar kinase family protein [Treponema sp.]
MYTLLVLADDLTGALDTAVKFAKRGIPAQVLVRWKGAGSRSPETEAPPGGGVLVINTNTRHCPAAEARSTVMQVLERYSAVPYV